MSKALAARAAIVAALFMMLMTFVMHSPCRNSNYTDSQFTSFCYSDIPVQFSEKILPGDIAPVQHGLMWLVSKIPGDFLLHTVLFQLIISAAFVAATILVSKFPVHKPKASILFGLMPLWAFTIFISGEIFAILFSLACVYYFYNRQLNHAAVFAGLAAASGS